ncbi:MAG: glycosyltransferase [Myxococcales bacterium]|nr:glycosyltransferase [Myxococcales bacterium]
MMAKAAATTATPQPLRICMLAGNPLLYDGRVLRHAETLARAGHAVTLIGVLGPNDPPAEGAVLPGVPNLRVVRIDRRRAGLRPRLRWLTSALRRRLAALGTSLWGLRWPLPQLWVAPIAVELLVAALDSQADVFHANDLDTLVPAAWAAWLRSARFTYDAHELYADERPSLSPLERSARAHVEGTLIAGAAACFTVNALLADELSRRYGIAMPIVLHNVPRSVPRPPRASVTAFSVARPLRLLLHGSWVGLDQPGVDSALAALAQVPYAVLTLRGGVRDPAGLAARIAQHGLTGRVTVKPRLPGAEALVAAAIAEEHDVGLSVHLPDCESRRLATSSKIFEYLMAGLYVIAADQRGNRHILSELAEHEPVGLLFSPDDAASLADVLRQIAADPELLQRRQHAARRLAESVLCWERESERLLHCYRRLSEAGSPSIHHSARAQSSK